MKFKIAPFCIRFFGSCLEYYTIHFAQYHEKTFHIDPAAFLSPFAANLKPGGKIEPGETASQCILRTPLSAG